MSCIEAAATAAALTRLTTRAQYIPEGSYRPRATYKQGSALFSLVLTTATHQRFRGNRLDIIRKMIDSKHLVSHRYQSMTPAIKLLQKQKIDFEVREYTADEDTANYGMQAAAALDQSPLQVFKTLLAVIDGNDRKPVVAIIPVAKQLDLKKLASHFTGRKATMADPAVAERVTGYIVGGISPVGQKQRLKCCIDKAASDFDTIYVSGGRRGLQLELKPDDLAGVINAGFADVSKQS